MIKQKCIPLSAPAEWKDALKGIPHAFAHTWDNCYAMHLTTRFNTYLYCFETAQARIVCPISERKYNQYTDIVTPYGFSGFVGNGDCPEFSQYWKDFVRERGYICGYIQLNPLLENKTYFDPQEAHRYNSIYIIDLRQSLVEVSERLAKSRRKQVKKISLDHCNIILDRKLLVDFLLANFSNFFRRKGASAIYNFSRETLSFLCNLDCALLVGAGERDLVQAVSLLTYTPDLGEAFVQVSLPGGQHHAVNLVWYRLCYLKELQIPYLNLGGGVRENDGVAQFKESFGGRKMALRCLKQIYNREVYEQLCSREQVVPYDLSGYFPPYHNPNR